MPASKAGTFGYLTPVFGVAGAFVLLGERPTLLQAAGIGLVLLSIVADVLPQRPASQPALESSAAN
ncbi:EamA-like transporter family protein [compost metagenome]